MQEEPAPQSARTPAEEAHLGQRCLLAIAQEGRQGRGERGGGRAVPQRMRADHQQPALAQQEKSGQTQGAPEQEGAVAEELAQEQKLQCQCLRRNAGIQAELLQRQEER